VEKSHGILVRLTKLSDTSWIVHWCTAEHGWIKTVAKGARRSRSPFAGRLDLFFDAEIEWARARRGELHHLREVAVTATRDGLRRRYTDTLLAGYCCRLLEIAVEREHPLPELHDLLRRALDHVTSSGASARALRHYENELARLLGIAAHRSPTAATLAEALGGLPPLRAEILARLSQNGRELDSSSEPESDKA
jgi:DNA repair protein RecO (recombination protein O)